MYCYCVCFFAGHEACFAAFLCCLFKLRVLDQGDCVAIVFKVFQRQVVIIFMLASITNIIHKKLDIDGVV